VHFVGLYRIITCNIAVRISNQTSEPYWCNSKKRSFRVWFHSSTEI